MSQKKGEDIVNWSATRNIMEVQWFIAFANFYCQFIQGFSSLMLPIQVLTHNGVMWNWSEQCEKAFVEFVEVQVYGRYTVCNKEQRSTRDLVKEREEVRSL